MNKGGFSFKRFIGISQIKSSVSRKIGIPLTKTGRERKVGAALGPLVPIAIALLEGVRLFRAFRKKR
jgi:hypothetical protein